VPDLRAAGLDAATIAGDVLRPIHPPSERKASALEVRKQNDLLPIWSSSRINQRGS